MRYSDALKKTLASAAALAVVTLGLVVTTFAPSGPVPPAAAATGSTGNGGSTGNPGYWLVASTGQVYQEGTTNYGDLRGYQLARPVVGGAATNDGLGYWMVATDGGIFAFGDAAFHGSTGGIKLAQPIVGMAADPATGGYWMVASDGGIFAFDAPFYGSTGGIKLNKPVVGMAATPSGHGYWLVASDGGIFAFGDARFHGSTGNVQLAQPIVSMAATADAGGYWMAASDGGIFAFGDAAFHGSTGGVKLAAPVVGMQPTPSGNGYWLAASDGGVFPFGDAPMLGVSGTSGSPPIVTMMSTPYGYPFPPGGTGYDVSQYQCPDYPQHVSGLPSSQTAVAVVQVSGGAINQYQPPTCYPEEAAWAGTNISDYIFLNPLPSPTPPESKSGPAGNCSASDGGCQSYNFGYYWAQKWVAYARADNTHPTLWWLDVEKSGGWATDPASQKTNSQVIAGAVAGLRASGVEPGIYATHLQWDQITGDNVSFPHIPLWVPGADNVSGDTYSATSICSLPPENVDTSHPLTEYSPFAGGTTVLVQYGYGANTSSIYDRDYACS